MYFNLDSYQALKMECQSCIGKVRRKLAEIFGTLGYYECIALILDFELELLRRKYRNTLVTKDLINAELNSLVFDYFLNGVYDTPIIPEEVFDGNLMLIALYDIIFFDGEMFKDLDYLSDCIDVWKEEAGYFDLLNECEANKEFWSPEDVENIKEESRIRELINLHIRHLYEVTTPLEYWTDPNGIRHLRNRLGCRIIGVDNDPDNEANSIIEDWVMF